MVAEQVRLVVGERISERICEQIADVHVPQVAEQVLGETETPSRDRTLQGTAEHILDDLVPDMVEQTVKLPKTVSENRIQELTVEHTVVDIPVLQVAEELVKVSKVFPLDRIQQRLVEQTNETPDVTLAEKVFERPVTRTQQVVNSSVQHIVNTVEVEKPKIIELTEIIKMTVQRKKLIIQEKINQGTKSIEFPLAQFLDKAGNMPVVVQRQASMAQTCSAGTARSNIAVEFCWV